jgi:hypothetical protein
LYKKLNRLGLLSFGNGSSEEAHKPPLINGTRDASDGATIPDAPANGSRHDARHHAAS